MIAYFPIAWKIPENDPYGITPDDLKLRLRECISASSDFAIFTFPKLIETLDAPSVSAKVSPVVSPNHLQSLTDL